jgi:riboflavin kinase/FMN adenylyltransferase
MKYIAGNTDFKLKNTAVTLGKFDGLHLGHQLLLEQVKSYKAQGLTTVMFSFLYHPCNLFSDKEFELIYTEEEKHEKVKKSGLDVLVSYPFTEGTRSIEPEDFIKNILVDKLDAKIIVVGNDFHFGHDRKGDIKMLQKYEKTYGYRVIACEKRKSSNGVISSSAIRSELKDETSRPLILCWDSLIRSWVKSYMAEESDEPWVCRQPISNLLPTSFCRQTVYIHQKL